MPPDERVTKLVRVYRGDYHYVTQAARSKTAEQRKRVTPADVIRDALAALRQQQEQERGE